ncbi:endonuclease/exonuclease/phosphatase family protein [Pseudalkalibacillus sp. A8]|uniref:endonuclease/exonuclease/phosphatase family protein n=1 Tax=Pseudalkalibacillus sp. A8 TaxID=3382641 RepID=UPI0038B575CA
MELKIMTFNIRHGKGMDKNHNLQRISQVLKNSKADIIGLNEVDKEFSKRSEFVDQAEWIAKDLNMGYVFGPSITRRGKKEGDIRQYGSAILTRFPIITSDNYPFDFLPRIVEDRSLLKVIVEIEKREVAIYITHLSFAPFLHSKQTEFILERVTQDVKPSVIMGDWNMKPYSSSWKLVTEQLKDTWEEQQGNGGSGYTFPSRRPRMKLDYIFMNDFFEVLEAKVVETNSKASDHLPLSTTLRLLHN